MLIIYGEGSGGRRRRGNYIIYVGYFVVVVVAYLMYACVWCGCVVV